MCCVVCAPQLEEGAQSGFFFPVLELIWSVSHIGRLMRRNSSKFLLAAEKSMLPLCAGDKCDTASNIFQYYLHRAGNYWQTALSYAVQMHLLCTQCCNAFHPFIISVSFQTDAKQLLQSFLFVCLFVCEEASGMNIFSCFSRLRTNETHKSVDQHDWWSVSFPSLQSSEYFRSKELRNPGELMFHSMHSLNRWN